MILPTDWHAKCLGRRMTNKARVIRPCQVKQALPRCGLNPITAQRFFIYFFATRIRSRILEPIVQEDADQNSLIAKCREANQIKCVSLSKPQYLFKKKLS